MDAIAELMQPQSMQMATSTPSAPATPSQALNQSDTAEIDRLLAMELQKLSIEDKRKVYRYVIELQIKRQGNEV